MRIVDESNQPLPVLKHVVDRFAQATFRQPPLLNRPRSQLIEQRFRFLSSTAKPYLKCLDLLVTGQRIGVGKARFDREDATDQIERMTTCIGVVRLGFNELSPCVRQQCASRISGQTFDTVR